MHYTFKQMLLYLSLQLCFTYNQIYGQKRNIQHIITQWRILFFSLPINLAVQTYSLTFNHVRGYCEPPTAHIEPPHSWCDSENVESREQTAAVPWMKT